MMGTETFQTFQNKDNGVRSCADMLIVASEANLAAISDKGEPEVFPGLATFPSGSADDVPETLLAGAQILVIEVDPVSSRSLDRLRSIVQAWPDLPTIAAIGNATVALARTLVREGISDVVSLPLQLEELLDVAAEALREKRTRNAPPIKLGPQIAIVRSTGGCGATSFATHLAGAIGSIAADGAPAALVDFDLQRGLAAEYLGANGASSIADLLQAGDRLDSELLGATARTTPNHVDVFASPSDIQPIEAVDVDRALEVLSLIRQGHSAVLVDLPADWTNWALSVVSASDLTIMVVEMSVASLRQAKRQLDLFSAVGIDPGRVLLVVNRVEKKMFRSVDLSDVTDTLKHEIAGSLAIDADIGSAQAQGRLLGEIVRKSRYAADVHAVAELVAARLKLGAA